MDTSAVVVTPEVENQEPPRLLVLLHGLTGNHMQWASRVDLPGLANEFNLVIAAPNGERSFWLNQAYGLKWGSWIGSEFPKLLMSHIRALGDPIIGGLSMGGYGAFRAAFDRPGTYSAAFSLSGTLDVSEEAFRGRHPDLYRIGFGDPDKPRPEDDLVNREAPALPLFACCGESDRLYNQNLKFVDAHPATIWESGPGAHNFEFWSHWLPKAVRTLCAAS